MPIGTQRAWLTEETDERARIELAELLTRRDAGSFVERGDKEQCARKIRRLQELLGDASLATSHRMTASPSPAWRRPCGTRPTNSLPDS